MTFLPLFYVPPPHLVRFPAPNKEIHSVLSIQERSITKDKNFDIQKSPEGPKNKYGSQELITAFTARHYFIVSFRSIRYLESQALSALL